MGKVRVESYGGYKADERPAAFTLGARRFLVRAIMDRWCGEDHDYFKLIADDGNLYVLRRDRTEDEWEMVLMEAPAKEKL